MDEILIGEKKYVSSKRAAKMTGYAKDYIGQLCREGRVPARLVGRSWYVLETAIQDHRFGDQKIEEEREEKVPASSFASTWDAPRYEAVPAELLPSVNRLQDDRTSEAKTAVTQDSEEGSEAFSQRLHDSWRAWFDHIETQKADSVVEMPEKEPENDLPAPSIEREEAKEDGDINIPIHTLYEPPPKELLPARREEVRLDAHEEERKAPQRRIHGLIGAITAFGIILAFLAATSAAVGTGYFDKNISSVSQASVISGIILYDK
ncbi:MAG: hypothetical protein KGH56_03410 [Patescibacteria group bacterium]|nr:hypothetical protein [Patescibacteria group bacterium]